MKTIRIIQLILLLIIIAVLIAILVVGTLGNFSLPFVNFFKNATVSNSVLIYDQEYDGSSLDLIDTSLSSADIEYNFSQNSEIRVVYYGPEKEKDDPIVKTNYDSSTLKITQQNRVSLFNIISGEKVIIYLPAGFDKDIISDTASGNIEFHEDIRLNSLNLELSSGNVVMKDLAAKSMRIAISSGRVSAEAINVDEYSVKLSSGNFKSTELIGSGDIISTSGNADIDSYSGGGIIKSTSGNVDVGISKLTSDLDIGLTSGNISVDILSDDPDIECHFDVLSGSIRTNFGNINKNVTGASLNYEFSDNPMYKLSIKTTSGNIRANVQ